MVWTYIVDLRESARRTLGAVEPFAVATGLVTLALLLKYLTPHSLLPEIPFLLFFSAVVISGIYGGFWTGLYATALSAAIADYFFLPPYYTFVNNNWHQDFKVGLYVLDCVTMAGLCGRLRTALERTRRLERSEAQARGEAERADRFKSAFLANMSHEIRTPLGAMLGYAELLEQEGDESQRARFVQTILRNGRALNRIIDDVLDLAKIEADRLEVERVEFSLDEVVAEVCDLFRETARAKGLYLTVTQPHDLPARLTGDPTRVRQMLINVVGNAFKFTRTGGVTVAIALTRAGDGARRVRLSVRDTGIGLTAAQAARLFEPFVQAQDSTTRTHGGTGLGLAISRKLARALGGDLTLADAAGPDAGCTFVITFLA